MRKLILISAGLAAAAAATAPGAAKPAKCDAQYYGYLVGRDRSEAQSITGSDYRLVPAGGAVTTAKPSRMTIRYDKQSNRIVDVSCG